MDEKQKAKTRRLFRSQMLVVMVSSIVVGGLSLWIRTGHPITMPICVSLLIFMLIPVVSNRVLSNIRQQDDAEYKARVIADLGSWRERYWRLKGTIAAEIVAAILLTLGFGTLIRANPAIAAMFRQIFGPSSPKILLAGLFAISFAVVYAVVRAYDRTRKR